MRRIAIIAVVLCAATQLGAQNINQSVAVTNEYETKFADFVKNVSPMAIPDSLYDFDYNFDYSVFETPYKGSYEFSPYRVKFTPEASLYDGRKFYLKAGAGYSMHPVFDFVYTPVQDQDKALSIYNFGSGFAGREFYDLNDRLALSGYKIFKNNTLNYTVGYDGVFAGHSKSGTAYNSAFASVALKSASNDYFIYDIGVDYRYGHDSASQLTDEHMFSLSGVFGPVIGSGIGFLLDFGFDVQSIGSLAKFTPSLDFSLGMFDIAAGLRVDYLMQASNKLTLAPELEVSVDILADRMKARLAVEGGRELLSNYALRTFNHFAFRQSGTVLASRKLVDAYLGLDGHLGSSLQYAFRGGWAAYADSPLDCLGGLAFVNYSQAYASFDFKWTSERVEFNGGLDYAYSHFKSTRSLYVPSAIRSDFAFSYNWLKRIYAGAELEFASARKDLAGLLADVPAYADLALVGDYRMSRNFSIWAKAGNLLGMQIQRVPGYVEKGPYFTAGISLIF